MLGVLDGGFKSGGGNANGPCGDVYPAGLQQVHHLVEALPLFVSEEFIIENIASSVRNAVISASVNENEDGNIAPMMEKLAESTNPVASMEYSAVSAREIHVSKTGDDSNSGTSSEPFLTIQKAADIANAGDVITVHEGIYREWVKPARGGNGEDSRIVYQAAPGQLVYIKGSEQITSWTDLGGGIWKVEIPSEFFGDYNPYELRVSDKYMTYGQWHHRGDVYINGKGLYEKQLVSEVGQFRNNWHCAVASGVTTITADFRGADPNEELVEINKRESVFMPVVSGLQYITVSGFHIMHAATNWVPPSPWELQMGAIAPRIGNKWIIENCNITDNRTVGVVIGLAPGMDYEKIDTYGDHIIRNNIIQRCGQAGIAGKRGGTRSLITGNLIEDINYREEFGGHETAGIKLHRTVDVTISDNLIRRVYSLQDQAAWGIWIDFGAQGMRITRNIIYDTETATLFLEMNHGPILVDNNILVGKRLLRSNSESSVFAHNLLVNGSYRYNTDKNRQSQYYTPHTTIELEHKPVILKDDKWFNNIFIRNGLNEVPGGSGFESDFNVFYEGAEKSTFGDEHSIVDTFSPNFKIEDNPLGTTITFSVNNAPFQVRGKPVSGDLVGVFETTGQTIEDRDGNPITVDSDFYEKEFSKPIPGPLSQLKKGSSNTITWSF